MARRVSIAIVALGLLAASCGDDAPAESPFPADAFALTASSNLAVGQERLLVAVSGPDGARLSSPDIPIQVTVHPDGPGDAVTVPATFMWLIPDHSGLYRANIDFPSAGTWWVTVTPEAGPAMESFPVTVHTEPLTPGIGATAPRSESATAADGPLDTISTDTDPNPRFYEMSIADAVTSGRPSVIVFATPKFCTTGVCGPTLDDVKELAPAYPDVNFLHVEVFTNLDDPSALEVVPAVVEWGLPTEPWIFVVDASGVVVGRFEGVVARDELEALLR